MKKISPAKYLLISTTALLMIGTAVVLKYDLISQIRLFLGDQQLLTPDTALVGRVIPEPKVPTRVFLLESASPSAPVIGSTKTGVSGLFAFLLPPDQEKGVHLHAFQDDNNNRQPDSGEASWRGPIPDNLAARSAGVFDLSLTQTAESRTKFESLDQDHQGLAVPIAFGDVADLEDPRLQSSTGVHGLWRSRTALHQRGFGIYFLTTFDPARTPVLFVHGAAGTPQDFQTLTEQLDARQFQPWVFAYPSGLSLAAVSDALTRMVLGLKRRHAFNEIVVVAHSMGGTVAMAAVRDINHASEHLVRKIVTISTPFGGHAAAGKGVDKSPVVVPSWRDIKPGSTFLQQLALHDPNARHLLLFGEKTRRRPFLESPNDGVVSVKSQLHEPVRIRAQATRKFDLGHTEILHDPAVFEEIHRFIR